MPAVTAPAGGDSLAAAAVTSSLGIPVDLLLAHPTARKLASALRGSQPPSRSPTPIAMLPDCLLKDELPKLQLPSIDTSADHHSQLWDGEESAAAGDRAAAQKAWVQQARVQLSKCCMEGGWVAELGARPLRWSGPSISDATSGAKLSYNSHNGVDHAASDEAQACLQQQQQPMHKQHQQHQHVRMQARGQNSDIAEEEAGQGSGLHRLRCGWRVKLKECVDAAPVVLIASHCGQDQHQQEQELCQQQQHQHQGQQKPGHRQHWVFACSHGGDVVCVEGHLGGLVWEGQLPGRADAGLTISSDCKVPLNHRPRNAPACLSQH